MKRTSVKRALFIGVGLLGLSSLCLAVPVCPGAAASLSSIGVSDTVDGTTGILTNNTTGSCLFGSSLIGSISLGGSNVANGASANNIDAAALNIAFSQVGTLISVTITDPGNWALSGSQQFSLKLSYTVTGSTAYFFSFGDSFTGATGSGFGNVSFDETANAQNQSTLSSLGGPSSNSQIAFNGAPISTFTVVNTINEQASNGSANLTSFTDTFVVPEPMTSMLFGSGLLAFGFMLHRKRR